jgi:hypothetical protein
MLINYKKRIQRLYNRRNNFKNINKKLVRLINHYKNKVINRKM